MTESGSAPPPGWYPNGNGGTQWWDGTAWTEYYAPPPAPPAPQPPPVPGAAAPVAPVAAESERRHVGPPLELHGYMVEITLDGTTVSLKPTNMGARFALTGLSFKKVETIPLAEIVEMQWRDANAAVNGRLDLFVRNRKPKAAQLHFRYGKQQEALYAIRDALVAAGVPLSDTPAAAVRTS